MSDRWVVREKGKDRIISEGSEVAMEDFAARLNQQYNTDVYYAEIHRGYNNG